MEDETYWTLHVTWGAKIYADAPASIRERLETHYPTFNGAAEAAMLVTQWARIPIGRSKIMTHSGATSSLRPRHRKPAGD